MFRRAAAVMFVLVFCFAGEAAAAAAKSAVCEGKAPVTAGSSEATLESGDLTRIYRLFIPDGYDPSAPAPLVLSLHGAISSAAEQEEKSGWNAIAEREGFVMAYPQGYLPLLIGFRWKAGEPMATEDPALTQIPAEQAERVDDVAFLSDLIAHLSDTLCIDPARVYMNGFSNGGGMTHHAACELADRIAAIGTNAGAYTPIPGGCMPSRPVPVVTFQGKLDRIVPYEGSADMGFQGVEAWAADWAARNDCGPVPVAVEGTVGAVSGLQYTGCTDDAAVIVYIIADGGHTWPGGGWGDLAFLLGRTSTDIDASETMWGFFAAHPIRER